MDIYLIYASTSGNVEIVMESIGNTLLSRGFKTTLCRAEETSIEVVGEHHKFVLGTSTWEHGRLNPFFAHLYEQLKTLDCQGKQAAFVGLGDRRYEPVLFCEGIEKIRRLWLQEGGYEISTVLKIQGEPYAQIGSVVKPWTGVVAETFNSYHA